MRGRYPDSKSDVKCSEETKERKFNPCSMGSFKGIIKSMEALESIELVFPTDIITANTIGLIEDVISLPNLTRMSCDLSKLYKMDPEVLETLSRCFLELRGRLLDLTVKLELGRDDIIDIDSIKKLLRSMEILNKLESLDLNLNLTNWEDIVSYAEIRSNKAVN